MAPNWEQTIPVAGPPDTLRFGIGVQMRNMPTDGWFAFNVPGYDAESTIIFPPPPNARSPVYRPDLAVLVMVTWRAGFVSSMTMRWWQGATAPPPDATITPVIAVPAADGVLFDTFPNSTFDEPWEAVRMRPDVLVTRTF
ncbi:hypothetical protein [Conexibacter woesei]|uniref:Uncharacterized protein n=1 Tax=Conexibacter woesei (strain DSM 14684 / CCUG 47730 / CIP 108061 / JCM 11494 / NBRC 100937 / ID131577) TaxID=469383 RepID=D3F8M3_CONWI|nr:hypothetical protein [Conexibacter woesei]ADB50987.1 hypothetical protein Cwoe_2566 [Conexibacter woesei DSM 14684]